MKIIIFALVLLACGTMAQNSGYVKLSTSTINKSQLIQDLRQLGAEYTLEKGIFQQKPKLPNGYWGLIKTESVYRKIANGANYYQYTVQLENQVEPYLIQATYIVAFRPSNGNTLVTSYSYKTIKKNYDGPIIADAPTFLDMRLLKKGSKIEAFLNEGIKFTVKDAISKGLIKKSTYSFVRIFSLKDVGYSIAPGYTYLIQIVGKQGQNYRAQIIVYDNTYTTEHIDPIYTIYPNA